MKQKFMIISVSVIVFLTAAVPLFMNQKKFGRHPKGERLERIENSPNYLNGEFRNLSPTPEMTSESSRFKAMKDFLFEKRERNKPDSEMHAVKTDIKNLNPQEDILVWFGHSSYFIQTDGRKFLVDPVFYDASPLSMFNKPFKGTDIYKPEDMPDIDYLIITHDHWDHLDYKTVTEMRERLGTVICPLGVGEHFERWGFSADKLIEMDWNEKENLGAGLRINCLPARHFSGRTFKRNKTLWASFMLETPSRNIYLSGDGGYDYHFKIIAEEFPEIDLAIMENGQYDQNWKYIHFLPADLISAVKDLNPKNLITGHHSKYALARHAWDEPSIKIDSAAKADSLSLIQPVIGEVIFL